MRVFFAFLILPALAFAAPGKRLILDDLDQDKLKADIQQVVNMMGANATEQACEDNWHKFTSGLLYHSAGIVCHSLQVFIQRFNIVPDTTTTAAQQKRFLFSIDDILGLLDVATLKQKIQEMFDLIGSDPTEQACEQAGHKYLTGLFDHSVPLICHSFQSLVQHFNIGPDTKTQAVLVK